MSSHPLIESRGDVFMERGRVILRDVDRDRDRERPLGDIPRACHGEPAAALTARPMFCGALGTVPVAWLALTPRVRSRRPSESSMLFARRSAKRMRFPADTELLLREKGAE